MRKIVSMGAVAFVAIGIVQAGGKAANVPAADLKWAGAGAPGVSTAVVEGDMAKGPSHFYLKYAAGLATPVHHHTADHYVHLVSGSLVLVQGGGQEVKLAPGSYFEFTSKAPHAARCEGSADCVMFVDARGPWDVVPEKKSAGGEHVQLGAFSISLVVRDIAASRAFYEKLGFKEFGGNQEQRWLILKNGDVLVGLFQGMFEKNMLTFNPGWDQNAQAVSGFTDVRELQRRLRAQGVAFAAEADETTQGPASFVVVDPDGNPILVDQHR